MAVTQGDLSLKKAVTNGDTAATNGGRMSDSDVTAALFPDITAAERQAGKTRYRKIFLKNSAGVGALPLRYSDAALELMDAKAYFENFSPAGDHFLMKAGTPIDTQSDIVNTGWAATGYLEADVAQGATSCQFRCEIAGSTGELFQVGGTLLISDLINGSGNREFVTISSVSWGAGGDVNLATIGFTATPLQFAYSRNALAADRTADILTATTIGYTLDTLSPDAQIGRRVRIKSATLGAGQIRRIVDNSATFLTIEHSWDPVPTGTVVYEILKTNGCMTVALGGITPAYSTVTYTSAAGVFTELNNLKLFPVGCRDDHWTLTFSDATHYTIVGTHYGQQGTTGVWSTGAVARPTNGDSYFFEVGTSAWSGTWAPGDTVEYDTTSSSAAVWIKEVVPTSPAVGAHLSNSVDIGIAGDTV